MVDRKTYTCLCGERPRIDAQGAGWIKVSGKVIPTTTMYIVTCDNRACEMYGATRTLDNHAACKAALQEEEVDDATE